VSLVSTGWIVLAIAVVVAGLTLATSWLRRDHDVDLGSVSDQWIAEHRTGQGHDSPR